MKSFNVTSDQVIYETMYSRLDQAWPTKYTVVYVTFEGQN